MEPHKRVAAMEVIEVLVLRCRLLTAASVNDYIFFVKDDYVFWCIFRLNPIFSSFLEFYNTRLWKTFSSFFGVMI